MQGDTRIWKGVGATQNTVADQRPKIPGLFYNLQSYVYNKQWHCVESDISDMKSELTFYVPLIARSIPLAYLKFLQTKIAPILSLKTINCNACYQNSKQTQKTSIFKNTEVISVFSTHIHFLIWYDKLNRTLSINISHNNIHRYASVFLEAVYKYFAWLNMIIFYSSLVFLAFISHFDLHVKKT
jgi:hypothetical protein